MAAIAEHVVDNYVPVVEGRSREADEDKIYGQVPFVGDQLTVERLRNMQRTRRTADSVKDRLEPLIPVVADWHAKQSLYGVCIRVHTLSSIYALLYETYYYNDHQYFWPQVMMKRLFSGTSSQEGGTLFQLRNLINRRNVSHVTKGKVNEIEDFFELVTVCHIQAVFMQYFGMNDTKGSPTLNMATEHTICQLSANQRRSLLRRKVADIVDRYITTNWAGASATSERVRGLEVTGAENFRTDHSYSATDSPFTPASGPHSSNIDDGVLAYACAVLSDGMFMLEFRDAIREGDGERAIRCWTVMMLYFKAAQRVKYALEGFHLLAQIKALLPKRLAEEVMWNRFINTSGGLGRNISLDFHMEHMNRTYKEQISRMGSNVSSKTLDSLGQAFRQSTAVSDNLLASTNIHTPAGRHSAANTEKDESAIIKELVSSQIFEYRPGRHHASFRSIKSNVFSAIDADAYLQWLQSCLDQLRKEQYINRLLHDNS